MLEVNSRKYKLIKDEYVVINDTYIPLPIDGEINKYAPIQEVNAILAMGSCQEAVKVVVLDGVTALIDKYTVSLIDSTGKNVYIMSQVEFSNFIPRGGETKARFGNVTLSILDAFALKGKLNLLGGIV